MDARFQHDEGHACENTKQVSLPMSTIKNFEKQSVFVSLCGAGTKKVSWRPAVVHRTSARKWLYNTDAQLRYCTASQCWVSMKPDFALPMSPIWADWRQWPYCLCAIDLGSDGLCAAHWLGHGLHKVNMGKWAYYSQGANRSMICALEDVTLTL